jgi:hypothetical protein
MDLHYSLVQSQNTSPNTEFTNVVPQHGVLSSSIIVKEKLFPAWKLKIKIHKIVWSEVKWEKNNSIPVTDHGGL